jgi:hypothetical protein
MSNEPKCICQGFYQPLSCPVHGRKKKHAECPHTVVLDLASRPCANCGKKMA